MTTTAESLWNEVASLNRMEQEALYLRLGEALGVFDDDAEWLASLLPELNRRVANYRSGRTRLLSCEEADALAFADIDD